MAERKVLIKYYPPNFDPERLIKNKRPKDKQDNVRMMLPNSLRCSTCGNYLYIGTKFNMRKETCLNEDYLGIRIYRFYLKCTQCYAEITFKTDPKNSDYVVEHGGVRNYEPWRDVQAAEETLKELKENEEEGNAMKFLENKTYDSKREMDILDALDEIKHLNKKKAQITHDELIKGFLTMKTEGDKLEDHDQKFIEDIEGNFKKRKMEVLDDEEEENEIDDVNKKKRILVGGIIDNHIENKKETPKNKIIKIKKMETKPIIKKEEDNKNKLCCYSDGE